MRLDWILYWNPTGLAPLKNKIKIFNFQKKKKKNPPRSPFHVAISYPDSIYIDISIIKNLFHKSF